MFGARASILHGAARLTADVDVTIDLGKLPARRLVSELRRAGFAPQFSDPAFIELTRVIPIVHTRTAIPVDLVLAGPGLEDLFFERATKVRVGRKLINVAAPEDIIVMKILAGRPRISTTCRPS